MNPAYFVFFFAFGDGSGPVAPVITNRFIRGLLVAPGKLVK